MDEDSNRVQEENGSPIITKIHHIFSNDKIRDLYSNMNRDYGERIKILEPYLNMPHIKRILDDNWTKISTMSDHGVVLHALIVQNTHNLIHGPGNRLNDPESGLDQALFDLMPPNYQNHMNQITDMSKFLSLPEPNYNIEWRKSGQKKRVNRVKNISVDLWIPQHPPGPN